MHTKKPLSPSHIFYFDFYYKMAHKHKRAVSDSDSTLSCFGAVEQVKRDDLPLWKWILKKKILLDCKKDHDRLEQS